MKLFGLNLFEKKANVRMYDFAQHGLIRMQDHYGLDALVEMIPNDPAELEVYLRKKADKKKKDAEKAKEQKTPKELHLLKTLNVDELQINCEEAYIDEQIDILATKLGLYGPEPKKKKNSDSYSFSEDGAVRYGRQEVSSMIERLNNRRKIGDVKTTLDLYPHTTNDAIRLLLSNHTHLEAKQAYDTLPDLPKEAADAMKKYKEMTQKLCGKDPVFYLIAEKAKRQDVQRKRDPILLAQSPFGFFWQILGAWDEEVKFLDEI